ncbi:MAG: PadR family transcriptional regulator [Promethearchaeati archaeon SRVP18_Atabeyarchaeia-1]
MTVDEFKALRRFVAKMTSENLWIYILRLLQESPRYGYEVRAMIDKRFGFKPATVTSYVILYKMARDGLVESKRAESEAKGKPDRKYYVITKDGERAMQAAKIILTKLMKNAFDLT